MHKLKFFNSSFGRRWHLLTKMRKMSAPRTASNGSLTHSHLEIEIEIDRPSAPPPLLPQPEPSRFVGTMVPVLQVAVTGKTGSGAVTLTASINRRPSAGGINMGALALGQTANRSDVMWQSSLRGARARERSSPGPATYRPSQRVERGLHGAVLNSRTWAPLTASPSCETWAHESAKAPVGPACHSPTHARAGSNAVPRGARRSSNRGGGSDDSSSDSGGAGGSGGSGGGIESEPAVVSFSFASAAGTADPHAAPLQVARFVCWDAGVEQGAHGDPKPVPVAFASTPSVGLKLEGVAPVVALAASLAAPVANAVTTSSSGIEAPALAATLPTPPPRLLSPEVVAPAPTEIAGREGGILQEEDGAVVRMQVSCGEAGRRARSGACEQEQAATRLQSRLRGRKARQRVAREEDRAAALSMELSMELSVATAREEDRAAALLQSRARGRAVRRTRQRTLNPSCQDGARAQDCEDGDDERGGAVLGGVRMSPCQDDALERDCEDGDDEQGVPDLGDMLRKQADEQQQLPHVQRISMHAAALALADGCSADVAFFAAATCSMVMADGSDAEPDGSESDRSPEDADLANLGGCKGESGVAVERSSGGCSPAASATVSTGVMKGAERAGGFALAAARDAARDAGMDTPSAVASAGAAAAAFVQQHRGSALESAVAAVAAVERGGGAHSDAVMTAASAAAAALLAQPGGAGAAEAGDDGVASNGPTTRTGSARAVAATTAAVVAGAGSERPLSHAPAMTRDVRGEEAAGVDVDVVQEDRCMSAARAVAAVVSAASGATLEEAQLAAGAVAALGMRGSGKLEAAVAAAAAAAAAAAGAGRRLALAIAQAALAHHTLGGMVSAAQVAAQHSVAAGEGSIPCGADAGGPAVKKGGAGTPAEPDLIGVVLQLCAAVVKVDARGAPADNSNRDGSAGVQ